MDTCSDPSPVSTAVLLAAGSGCRLQPLTRNHPKCLTEVGGVPILERLVNALNDHGFERLIVVVGYLEHRIRAFLEGCRGPLAVDYVVNARYRTTNNLYSLWLAREAIRQPFLLLESDLLFDAHLLKLLQQPDRMAVSPLRSWMNGTTVSIDRLQRVRRFHLPGMVRHPPPNSVEYKTVNMYSLSLSSWARIVRRLTHHVVSGRVSDYYESVFAEMVADGSLHLEPVFFDPDSWYEVDTVDDLHRAERLFGRPGPRAPSPA